MSDITSDRLANKLIADLKAMPLRTQLNDENTEIIYAAAYMLVQQENFESASRAFSMLVLFRPTKVKYLAGLAICQKKLDHPEVAAGIYAFMGMLEPEQPLHHLCVAECLVQQGKKQEARESLALVVQFCEANSGHEKILARAQAIDSLLSRTDAAA